MRFVIVAAACGFMLAPGEASAHAFLRAATPAVGSTVRQAPTEVVVEFTEEVEPMFSTIAVTDRSGARVDTGRAHLEGGETRLAAALKPLRPGTYKVVWHATATDTHKTEGSFTFTVRD
jgi:methionine-rich copper-binding protein CopC